MKNYYRYPAKLMMVLLLSTVLFACKEDDSEIINVINVKNTAILPSETTNSLIEEDENIRQINQQMGKIAYELMAIADEDSYFFSPVSLYLALAVLTPGTTDLAYDELKHKLIPAGINEDEFTQGLKVIIAELSDNKNFGLKNKSLVVIDKKLQFNDNYIANSTQLGADLISLDFLNHADESTKQLNLWVAQETNNLINPLFSQTLPPNTLLSLINTLYFKDDWQLPFKAEYTEKADFYAQNNTIEKDFMEQMSKYQYGENNNLQYIAMDYNNGAMMEIYLPKENLVPKDILEDVVELQNYSFDKQADHKLSLPIETQDVLLTLPKFSQEDELTLNQLLQQSGIKQIFKQDGSAGLDQFFKETTEEVSIDQIFQKSKVIVDEKGTEAAAATAIMLAVAALSERPKPKIMTVNRPFIYQIKYKGILLFIGLYNGD